MPVPIRQQIAVGSYLVRQWLSGRKRYPLVLMLEPLFRCNLACPGCGKIDYEDDVLNLRLSVEDCVEAVEDCGAPVVSIAGGEPLLHRDIGAIVAEITRRRRFVYLCTNALLLEKKLDLFTPGPYLTFSVHLDGLEEAHDRAVDQPGTFRRTVAAMRAAKAKGFRVNANATLFETAKPDEVIRLFDFVRDEIGADGITVSPGYAYERAPDQTHFLSRRRTKELFRAIFAAGRRRDWQISHTALYLDFLAGNQTYRCTPWSNPTRNVFGWQRPCYLLNEGYAPSFDALMAETAWDRYGTGAYEKCANCMAHCGYEGTAVTDTMNHPLKALGVSLRGIRTGGPMAPDIPLDGQRPAEHIYDRVVSDAARRARETAPQRQTGTRACASPAGANSGSGGPQATGPFQGREDAPVHHPSQ